MATPTLTFNPSLIAAIGSAFTILDASAIVNDGGNTLGAIRITLSTGLGSLGVVSGGSLTTTGTIGTISYLYESDKRLLSLTSSTATGADFTQVLRLAGYNPGLAPIDATQTIRINLGIPIYSPDNGHYYERVPNVTDPTSANNSANAKVFLGLTGYLANITSDVESAFLVDRLRAGAWIGGKISGTAGNEIWSWNAGPEAGQVFWNGLANGSAPTGKYTNWVSGKPTGDPYLYFNPDGTWDSRLGYSLEWLVEYSTVSGAGDDGLSGTRTAFVITVGHPAEIAALIQASTPVEVFLVNGVVTSAIGVSIGSVTIGASNGTHIQVSINLGTNNAGKRRQSQGFRLIGGSERTLVATPTRVGEVYNFVFLKTVDGSSSVNLVLN